MKLYLEALEIIKSEFKTIPQELESISLSDSLSRILAEDVYADVDQPPFDNSAVDGYAVVFNDQVRRWKLIGEISAGNFQTFVLNDNNNAVSIMTGSQIPEGCTAVIPIEDVEVVGTTIQLRSGAKYFNGINIRKKAEYMQKGQLAVSKNTLITPAHIMQLADCGKSAVKVHKKLTAAILSTGDELIDISEKPEADKIRATNIYALEALSRKYDFNILNLGIVKDDEELIALKVDCALTSKIDLLVTTGGVSVGEYDLLKSIFERMGVERKFWQANIKPGKPIYFGTHQSSSGIKLVFGLAGNPVSAFVNFYVFILPALESYYSTSFTRKIKAKLTHDLEKKDGKRHFIRGIYSFDENDKVYIVEDIGPQSSGNISGLSKANCLIIFEEVKNKISKGEFVECIVM